MVALVKKYGTERIIVNSAADWGVSDPLKVPEDGGADARERASPRPTSRRIVWQNPVAFFAQSGRLDLASSRRARDRPARSSSRATRCCAARRRVVEPRSQRMRRTVVLDVVGLDARARSASTRRTCRALAARGRRCGRCATITAGGHLLGAVDLHHRRCCRASTAASPTAGTSATSPRCGSGGSRTSWSAGEKIWEAARAARSRLHLRQAVLVVQHVQRGGLVGDAAAACTPPTAASSPTSTRSRPSCATSCSAQLGHVPAVQLLGAARRHRVEPLDRRLRARTSTTPRSPTLTLVYLPHLDYDLQRLGPDASRRSRSELARGRRASAAS